MTGTIINLLVNCFLMLQFTCTPVKAPQSVPTISTFGPGRQVSMFSTQLCTRGARINGICSILLQFFILNLWIRGTCINVFTQLCTRGARINSYFYHSSSVTFPCSTFWMLKSCLFSPLLGRDWNFRPGPKFQIEERNSPLRHLENPRGWF